MDTNTYKRYTAEQILQKQFSGNLYKGHDSVLHRAVMLYVSNLDVHNDSRLSVVETVKNGSKLPEERFMHVWDIEVDSHSIMIVLKPEPGYFLIDELENHALSLDEILLLIRNLGQGMQEAARDGIHGYSICANNIWIQGRYQPIIINYWNQDDPLWIGASGLGRLLYQLILRTKKQPAHVDILDATLTNALSELPLVKIEAISRWVRAAIQERKSLAVLLQGLDQLMIVHKEQDNHKKMEIEAQQTEEKLVIAKEVLKPVRQERRSMSRKQKWIIAGIIALALLVIEIVAVQLLRQPDEPASRQPESTKLPASSNPAPQPVTPSPQPTPLTPAPAKPKPAVDPEMAIVPNLQGLPLEEAEKKLLDLGLKYQYFLEMNEQSPGRVFKQEQPPEQKVEKGTVVTFYVGK